MASRLSPMCVGDIVPQMVSLSGFLVDPQSNPTTIANATVSAVPDDLLVTLVDFSDGQNIKFATTDGSAQTYTINFNIWTSGGAFLQRTLPLTVANSVPFRAA
jgi:hypothetical protein